MDNHFVAVLLRLPAGIRDPARRFAEVKRRMDAMKRSLDPLVLFGAANLMLRFLPQAVSHWVIDFLANKCTCVLTNVPGPPEPIYQAGSQVREMVFWVPQRARIGLGISILSYRGGVRIGVIADRAVLEEPMAFIEAFQDEFAELQSLI